MMTPKAIGNVVKRRRKEIGMDQREMALVSGTGVRFISDLENGKETCQLGKALKVLANLGLDLTLTPKSGARL
jgi:y4mF family transcriptional regulator